MPNPKCRVRGVYGATSQRTTRTGRELKRRNNESDASRQKKLHKKSVERAMENFEVPKKRQETKAARRPSVNAIGSRSFLTQNDPDLGVCDDPYYEDKDEIWKRNGMAPVQWYLEAMALGEPLVTMTDPEQPELHCKCVKTAKKVTFYMMSGNLFADLLQCI